MDGGFYGMACALQDRTERSSRPSLKYLAKTAAGAIKR